MKCVEVKKGNKCAACGGEFKDAELAFEYGGQMIHSEFCAFGGIKNEAPASKPIGPAEPVILVESVELEEQPSSMDGFVNPHDKLRLDIHNIAAKRSKTNEKAPICQIQMRLHWACP